MTTIEQTHKGAIDRRLSVAPMMDWTDRHDRYFLRLVSPSALLYTEMVTTGAILHGDQHRLLDYSAFEHPVAVQLGGSDPDELARCAEVSQQYGYDEVNLNVGCPSDRVQRGKIGACLMLEPESVARCMAAMRQAVDIPVTVKCRIGVDDQDDYSALRQFVETVAASGCEVFIIHARKAWLTGLSPKQNRDVPPLMYELVYQIKQAFPQLTIVINGGITSLEQSLEHLEHCDGVMIGREAYQNPFVLQSLERKIFDHHNLLSRAQVVEAMLPYINAHIDQGGKLQHVTRHMLGLFHGQPHGRVWRRILSEQAHREDAGVEVIKMALAAVTK